MKENQDRTSTESSHRQEQISILASRITSENAPEEDFWNLSALYIAAHKGDDSILTLSRFLFLHPNSNMGMVFLCDAMLMHPCVDNYLRDIRKYAMQLSESDSELAAAGYKFLDWVNYEQTAPEHDLKESLRLSIKAVEIAPDWPSLQVNLAWAHNKLGQYTEAEVSGKAICEPG